MTETWALASLWLGIALAATLLSIWLRVAAAPGAFILLLLSKMAAKFAGVWPVTRQFGAK